MAPPFPGRFPTPAFAFGGSWPPMNAYGVTFPGIPGSPFQSDQLRLWLTDHYHPWLYRPGDVAGDTRSIEVLH